MDYITSKDKILNYGWPMASAGKHYGGTYLISSLQKLPK